MTAKNKKRKDPKVGTGKKPKGSGRRLYTDENPKDTVSIKFATPSDARATVARLKNSINHMQGKYKSSQLESKEPKSWVKQKLSLYSKGRKSN